MAYTPINHIARLCKNCGVEFTFQRIGRGLARVHCSEECAAQYAAAQCALRCYAPCSVAGCGKPANRVGAGLCETHYYRQRRNGHVELTERFIPDLVDHTGGYKLKYDPGHPLANGRRVYEHRAVYYAAYGEGPFNCFHCGTPVSWGDMHVDHLNDRPDDNRIANLVASCPRCNTGRGRDKMRATQRLKSATRIEWQGVTRCVSEWADVMGISVSAMRNRLAKWPLDRVMTAPRGKSGPARGSR